MVTVSACCKLTWRKVLWPGGVMMCFLSTRMLNQSRRDEKNLEMIDCLYSKDLRFRSNVTELCGFETLSPGPKGLHTI